MHCVRTLLLLFLAAPLWSATESAEVWKDRALAIAVPVSAKIVSNSDLAKGVSLNQVFEVKLTKIKAIHGEILAKTADVLLLATSKEAIVANAQIFVLVSTTESKQIHSVLYWEGITKIACVPRNVIDGLPEEGDFSLYSARPDAKCINAEWFK